MDSSEIDLWVVSSSNGGSCLDGNNLAVPSPVLDPLDFSQWPTALEVPPRGPAGLTGIRAAPSSQMMPPCQREYGGLE